MIIKSSNEGKDRVRKVRTTVRFHRPRTFRPPRAAKFRRNSAPKRNRFEMSNLIEYPVTSEAAMKKIEDQNTLVFIVNPKATKHHIRIAAQKLYGISVAKVNTLVCSNGNKKAYVKLSSEFDQLGPGK